jgi:hypothetical protein
MATIAPQRKLIVTTAASGAYHLCTLYRGIASTDAASSICSLDGPISERRNLEEKILPGRDAIRLSLITGATLAGRIELFDQRFPRATKPDEGICGNNGPFAQHRRTPLAQVERATRTVRPILPCAASCACANVLARCSMLRRG